PWHFCCKGSIHSLRKPVIKNAPGAALGGAPPDVQPASGCTSGEGVAPRRVAPWLTWPLFPSICSTADLSSAVFLFSSSLFQYALSRVSSARFSFSLFLCFVVTFFFFFSFFLFFFFFFCFSFRDPLVSFVSLFFFLCFLFS